MADHDELDAAQAVLRRYYAAELAFSKASSPADIERAKLEIVDTIEAAAEAKTLLGILGKDVRLPIGTGPIYVPPMDGMASFILCPVEGFTLIDVEIHDPSDAILLTSITIGHVELIEHGSIPSSKFRPGNPCMRMFRGLNLFPAIPLCFHARNTSLAGVGISVSGTGIPMETHSIGPKPIYVGIPEELKS